MPSGEHVSTPSTAPVPDSESSTTAAALTSRGARADLATTKIRDWIIDGSLAPGSALVESQLAARLGVSRVPVREALQRLSQQGLVELRAGQSAQVVQRSARDVIELLEIRSVLAGLAATLAAERLTERDLQALSDLVEAGRAAVDREEWHEAGVLNTRFQAELARISGNNQLVGLIETSRFQLAWLNRHIVRRRGHQGWDVYTEMIDALRAGDGVRASEVIRAQLLRTKDSFVEDYVAGLIHT